MQCMMTLIPDGGKAEKRAQGSENYEGSKAHTKMMKVCKLQSLQNISQIISGDKCMMKPKIRKEIKLKSMLKEMEKVRA